MIVNGVYGSQAEADYEPLFEINQTYKERVISRIREKYSVDDEIAIIRQRDTKPLEFQEYNSFVEQIKEEERAIET